MPGVHTAFTRLTLVKILFCGFFFFLFPSSSVIWKHMKCTAGYKAAFPRHGEPCASWQWPPSCLHMRAQGKKKSRTPGEGTCYEPQEFSSDSCTWIHLREFNWKYPLATSKEALDSKEMRMKESRNWLMERHYAGKRTMTEMQSALWSNLWSSSFIPLNWSRLLVLNTINARA